MDIAEIRKKSGNRKREARQEPVSPESKPSSIQGVPGERMGKPAQENPPGILQAVNSAPSLPENPLDALFSWHASASLTTEDNFLRGSASEKAQDDFRQWLAFNLGSEEYTLDISNIREIIKPREITEIPRAPEFILGIISLRGIIIPVFDLKKRLRLGEADLTPASRIIVCQNGEREAGLLVDSINEVVRIPEGKMEPPPAVLSGLDRDLVEGVGRLQGRMMILLHLGSVLDAELV